MRAMARTGDGKATLVELKAVDGAYPLFGDVKLDPPGALSDVLAQRDGVFGAAADPVLLARLAIVPLVLEARGLDVTPPMIARLAAVGDAASAGVLQRIHDDEVGHVAIGLRWFEHVAATRGLEPLTAWQALVREHFRGLLKPPFNQPARERAGFAARFYLPLAEAAPHC